MKQFFNISQRKIILSAVICLTILGGMIYVVFSINDKKAVDPPTIKNAESDLISDTKPVSDKPAKQPKGFAVSTVMTNLDIPWDLIFLTDGISLVNERRGRLIVMFKNGNSQPLEADFSDLSVKGELGLMGMAADPAFAENKLFYTCQGDNQSGNIKVVAWQMDDQYQRADRIIDPLVDDIPSANIHNGCRLKFDNQGYLWISTGDAAQGKAPQDLNSLAGKILRVNPKTGLAAPGNPFEGPDASTLIYSFGHRNPQGLAWRPDNNQMWSVEHGPDIDDEINLLSKGGNYGWDPVSSTGAYYQQVPMTDKEKYPKAIEAQWSSGDPTLAMAGAVFLEGRSWRKWEGWLAVASLKDSNLHLFEFDQAGNFKNRFLLTEVSKTYGRLRTPVIGPDNALYITTSNGGNEDKILKVIPSN